MPKMKTHSGAKKRFKQTATGKIRARHAMTSHILEKKNAKRKRRLGNPAWIAKADEHRARKLLRKRAASRDQPPPARSAATPCRARRATAVRSTRPTSGPRSS